MRLLAVGDMHLGRVPVALPGALADRVAEFGPEVAWARAVEQALALEVGAVLLAGDVVESEYDFFSGYPALKRGLETLLDAGIEVIAVAGNHDTHVLPRLADALPGLTLLGRGGGWQTTRIDGATILGWSFPATHVARSPLADSLPMLDSGPVIGLLHCDLDARDSVYAPVARAELDAAPVDAWLLGHVHEPSLADHPRPIGYLGSISALRASETGPRGVWRIDLDDGRIVPAQIALAPLAYDSLTLEADHLDDPTALDGIIVEAARERLRQRLADNALPDALGLRITVTGTHDSPEQVAEHAARLARESPVFNELDTTVFVHRIVCTCRRALDLEQLAREPDAAGWLARDLLVLEGPDSEARRALIHQARSRLTALDRVREFAPLARPERDAEIAARLVRVGRIALERLLAQRQ